MSPLGSALEQSKSEHFRETFWVCSLMIRTLLTPLGLFRKDNFMILNGNGFNDGFNDADQGDVLTESDEDDPLTNSPYRNLCFHFSKPSILFFQT